jgi:hypothetical protein
MTSAINTANIDITYPIAGQDNDSQGFRDNFSAIQTGLSVAKSELTALQTNSVDVTKTTNNLQNTILSNGYMNDVYATSLNVGEVVANHDIDVTLASIQTFKVMTAGLSFRFTNWPTSGYYGIVRVHFYNTGNTFTPSLTTANAGTIHTATGFPSITLDTTGKNKVIEAWSYDNGANVYIRYVGEF